MRYTSVAVLFIVTTSLAIGADSAWADYHGKQDGRRSIGMQGAGPNSLVADPRGGVSNNSISTKGAASLVKERYSSSKVLGVTLLDERGPRIYRVRTLSPNGVVKSVFVDGRSGEVFE